MPAFRARSRKPRLLVAEDHAAVCEIVSLLMRDFDVVASVPNRQAAIEEVLAGRVRAGH
jgi:hypothetical protein